MRKNLTISVLFILMVYYSEVIAQNFSEREAIISVERIWDKAQHNAFTSLIYFKDKFYVAFREGAGHVSYINGTIRVLCSKDGQNWSSVAHLDLEGVDLRDAQLSITPGNKIMLNMGGSVYYGDERISMTPVVSFSDTDGFNFSDPEYIEIDSKIRTEDDWLWKVTWHKDIAYGTVYQVNKNGTALHLVSSKNGLYYDFVSTINVPENPNETALIFTEDDNIIAVIRRGGGNSRGYIGISEFPYNQWELNELSVKLGGPNIIFLPNGKILLGTREYSLGQDRKMILGVVAAEGSFKKIITLPSGGDCSYPGMVIKDNILYVTDYFSYENEISIYFASLRLNKIIELSEKQIAPKPILVKNKMGMVELKSDLQNSYIIYTLDGSLPSNQNGKRYDGPIKISSVKPLNAVTFSENYFESSLSSVIVGEDIFEEAIKNNIEFTPGLIYNYYDGKFSQVAEMQCSSISEKGISKSVTNASSPKHKNYGYQFSGLIKVPEDGLYTFYLESNDKNRKKRILILKKRIS